MPTPEDPFEAREQRDAETTTYAAIMTSRNGYKNPETEKYVDASRAALEIYRKHGRQPTALEIRRIMADHNVTRPTAEHVADGVHQVEEAKAKLRTDPGARYRAALFAEYGDDEGEYESDPDQWYEMHRDMMDG